MGYGTGTFTRPPFAIQVGRRTGTHKRQIELESTFCGPLEKRKLGGQAKDLPAGRQIESTRPPAVVLAHYSPAAQCGRSLRERRAAVRGLYNLLRPAVGGTPGLQSKRL